MTFMSCTSDFKPLFRLLDEYETHRSRPAHPTFTPAFDVREFSDSYHLDGELPGVDQNNIDIEFTDPQTLTIKGHTERHQPSTPSTPYTPYTPRWRQPTVEDDENEDSDSNSDSVPNHSETDTAKKTKFKATKPAKSAQPSFHYWASERSIGEFQRTFNFSARVDQNEVRATLKNGILSVIVPKEVAPKTKKIRIQ
ncbi:30 kDa heat shock protein [Penicillium taxi]|uniref:30 kDa heat shock protein n=1 Tax=Penicillium taxi TaxID=168475 RepID=UPI00254585FE|nr:30 kDa heat shock protein [Penicillium taxi]KAJ5894402.1 30 kDa heat shock protein [Penicillium taxi]